MKNYETNPRSAARKREDVVSGVRFSANKGHKSKLESTNKRTQGNGETALVLFVLHFSPMRQLGVRAGTRTNPKLYAWGSSE
jgi:hypothetical protein